MGFDMSTKVEITELIRRATNVVKDESPSAKEARLSPVFAQLPDLITKLFPQLTDVPTVKIFGSQAALQNYITAEYESTGNRADPLVDLENDQESIALLRDILDEGSVAADTKSVYEAELGIYDLLQGRVSAMYFSGLEALCIDLPQELHLVPSVSGQGAVYHNTKGPAVVAADGQKQYMLRGYDIPEHLHMAARDGTLTIAHVTSISNMEARRELMTLAGGDGGINAFLQRVIDSANLIHEGEYAALYEAAGCRFLAMIDGSYHEGLQAPRQYVMETLSTVQDADRALAASYGVSLKVYNPMVRT